MGSVEAQRFGCGRPVALCARERLDDQRPPMAVDRLMKGLCRLGGRRDACID
jgi:hypothetical protein